MIGQSLNQYRITAALGAGGMGEVFRARDTRLNRDVAVKVLPKDFVADADRLRRFEQEAKTLAALNHPNILTIHDAGVHEGVPYLVSELLEGKTLREEMSGAALPVRKATDYALQVAHGLAGAHGKGVVHRDLKPENLFVTTDGRVKILDFGLAKLRAPVAADVRRLTSKRGEKLEPPHVGCHEEGVGATIRIDPDAIINTTEPGMVLGTPAYMSPEQVRGEPAGHRADIFAFGAVFYEMLSGTRAFRRDTPVASMNAVLSEEPPELSSASPNIPPALERVVRRCLEKQPQRRFQTADDLAFAIENASASSGASSAASANAGQRIFRGGAVLPWALATILLAGLLLVIKQRPKAHTGGAAKEVRAFELALPVSTRKAVDNDPLTFAISPDGRTLAYANGEGLWIHRLDRIAPPIPLATGENISDPFWSPPGTEVGYLAGRKIYRVSVNGGTPALLASAPHDAVSGAAGATWLGHRIIFTTGGSALLEAPAQGGKVTTALPLAEGEKDFHHANALPGGRGVLFTIHRLPGTSDRIGVMSSAGQRKVLLELRGSTLWRPVFAPPHHVLFERLDESRGIWAFPISLETLDRTREPFRVSDVGGSPSAADDGTIVYNLNGWGFFQSRQLAWLDRSGRILNTVGPVLPGLMQPRLSPDERRAVALAGESIEGMDVWLFDFVGGSAMPFTRSPEWELLPAWGEGGRTIVFSRHGDGKSWMVSAPVDGSGPEERLFEGAGEISGSGKFLLVGQKSTRGTMTWGYTLTADASRKFVAFPKTFQRGIADTISPDDRWLAYQSIESGNFEVYLASFPALTNKVMVSRGGGVHPRWNPDGSELFYLSSTGQTYRTLMSRKLKPDGTLDEPAKVFDLPESIQGGLAWAPTPYAPGKDGNRLLMLQKVQEEPANQRVLKPNVRVVMNWFDEFREKK